MNREKPANIVYFKKLPGHKAEVYSEWLAILQYWSYYTIGFGPVGTVKNIVDLIDKNLAENIEHIKHLPIHANS